MSQTKCSVCSKPVDKDNEDCTTGYRNGIPFIVHAGNCEDVWRDRWPERYKT